MNEIDETSSWWKTLEEGKTLLEEIQEKLPRQMSEQDRIDLTAAENFAKEAINIAERNLGLTSL